MQKRSWADVPAGQLRFILAGKQYLLVRLVYQLVVVGWWAWLVRSGRIGMSAWTVAGGALLVAGFALRRWSMATLRERFRGFEVRREERGLETRGPYARVRHPGYLALAMMDAALPLLLGVPWLAALALAPFLIIVRRIRLEEQLLAGVYGDAYREYAAKTSRLLPGVY
jgi:protein-S-isoprenylcysteine O-methyltransferase Ste14